MNDSKLAIGRASLRLTNCFTSTTLAMIYHVWPLSQQCVFVSVCVCHFRIPLSLNARQSVAVSQFLGNIFFQFPNGHTNLNKSHYNSLVYQCVGSALETKLTHKFHHLAVSSVGHCSSGPKNVLTPDESLDVLHFSPYNLDAVSNFSAAQVTKYITTELSNNTVLKAQGKMEAYNKKFQWLFAYLLEAYQWYLCQINGFNHIKHNTQHNL